MLAGALRRARDLSADIGWRSALRVAPRWLVCRRYLGLVADLRVLALESPAQPEIRVTCLDAADALALSALDPAMTFEEVVRRLREGQQCTLGWWAGELAHYRWDATGPAYLPYLDRVLRPGPGEQIVVGIYTAPAYRGRGVAGATMVDASRRAIASGISRLVWLAAWWNARSLALADQFASRVVGQVGYWALGRHRRYFTEGQVWFDAEGCVRVGTAQIPASPDPTGRSREGRDARLAPTRR
jgi:GNAT superfamily N-acetyltransferase